MRGRINRASQLLHNSPSGLLDKALALSICPIWSVTAEWRSGSVLFPESMDRNHPLLRDFNFYACLSPKHGAISNLSENLLPLGALLAGVHQKALFDFF